ncbi:hypothetical protein J6590_025437 [Homalodisca vitripennis]|nr:hypothetical protein J6590_025437 [Homalodisca vitripennis]
MSGETPSEFWQRVGNPGPNLGMGRSRSHSSVNVSDLAMSGIPVSVRPAHMGTAAAPAVTTGQDDGNAGSSACSSVVSSNHSRRIQSSHHMSLSTMMSSVASSPSHPVYSRHSVEVIYD